MEDMVQVFRKECTASDTARDAGLTTPESIERFDNICYGTDTKWQVLDVYRPKAKGQKLPVIVSVHGGGWVYGDKEIYQFYCMNLAQRGFAVVNFTYRLAPEFKYPAQIEDTNSVFTWVMDNADAYGFDTEHIFAVGDSAGAQNIGLYAGIVTNPAYAAQYSFKAPAGLTLKAIGLNCGVFDVDEDADPSPFFAALLPEGGTKEELRKLSVLRVVTPAYPPCYILTSTGDFLKDAPPALIKELQANGVAYATKIYGTEKNLLGHVFHCNIKSEDAKIANDDECDFFKKFM